jgi:hypothetical protein
VLLPTAQIWKARVEPKCRFFDWLVLHNRILIADNMIKKNWACNPNCPLCYCLLESVNHLLIARNYSEALWNIISTKYGLLGYSQMSVYHSPVEKPSGPLLGLIVMSH